MKRHLFLTCMAVMGTAITAMAAYPVLFWDMEPIQSLEGGAALTLHHPDMGEVVFVHDAPWEGNASCYHTVLQDGDRYLMYYRGSAYQMPNCNHPSVTCCAESRDGVHWTRPNLGICEFNGSKDNNIILMDDEATHNFAPWLDTNPACPPEQRFKALGGLSKGLFLYVSADGFHWSKLQEEAVITKGAFDSLNTLIYDGARQCYVAYSRAYYKAEDEVWVRGIQRNTSPDGLHWPDDATPLDFGADAPVVELYTNGIHPYLNNPNVLIGIPKRFCRDRAANNDKHGKNGLPGTSDAAFMSSRDGIHFNRWDEALIRPGLQHERWITRNNMSAQGTVLTSGNQNGTPPVVTIYTTEAYLTDGPVRVRRHTIRLDGFVSVQAPYSGGSFTTRPIEVAADDPAAQPEGEVMLLLNASTSALGEIRCEVRDEQNSPIPGYTLADSLSLFGDELDLAMKWKDSADLKPLLGRKVILHFEMKDADIYSLRFGQPRQFTPSTKESDDAAQTEVCRQVVFDGGEYRVISAANFDPKSGKVALTFGGAGNSHIYSNVDDPSAADFRRKLFAKGYAIIIPFLGGDSWGREAASEGALRDLEHLEKVEGYTVPPRIPVFGFSMGGLDVLMFAARHPERVSKVAEFFGAIDLEDFSKRGFPVIRKLYPDEEMMKKSNPFNHISTLAQFPIRIYHGDKDPLVPMSYSTRLESALKEQGANVQLIVVPNVVHTSAILIPTADDLVQFLTE